MEMKSKIKALRRRDIVLVSFPFTDLSSAKVRPAVIITVDPQQDDVVIAFISSVTTAPLGTFDFALFDQDPDFSLTGLKKASVFKMNKLLTISSILILRRLGHTSPSLQIKLDALLKKALGLS